MQWIFTHLEGKKIIPPQVCDQVVIQGEAKGDVDALVSEELVEKGVIQVVIVTDGLIEALKNVENVENVSTE